MGLVSAMTDLLLAVVILLLHSATAHNDVVFAAIKEDENLATRLNCRVEEAEHFEYSGAVGLWASGRIIIDADIVLHCLGADVEGKYGSHALKYNVHISDLKMTQEADSSASLRREKRGAKEFFTNSWKKVKQLFNRMFGRKTEEPRSARDGDSEVAENEPEEISYEGLYSVPFQMVQLANGSIPELRFSENEVEDGRVRNFKRHIADAFSTHLSRSETVMESSVMGEHSATYNVTMAREKSSLTVAGWSSSDQSSSSDNFVMVEKSVTEDDIVKLAPSEALNDMDKILLKTLQTQIFRHGRLVSSSGSSSFNLLAEDIKNRNKREASPDEEDATFYMRAHSSFSIQSRKRRRRSVEESLLFQREDDFFRPVSRVAEREDVGDERKELLQLHKQTDFSDVFGNLLKDKEAIEEEDVLQSLSDILEKEARLELDKETNSLSAAVRNTHTLNKIKDICIRNFSSCKDYLHLLALAGGSEVETVFRHLLREVDVQQLLPLCDILSDLPRPSTHLLQAIRDILEHSEWPELQGSLSICLSNLASKFDEEDEHVVDLLLRLLEDEACGPSLIDVLEAVGNLRSERLVSRVLQVSEHCGDQMTVQIACVHALRHSAHLLGVQKWMEKTVRRGDCDVINEVVGALLDKIKDQEETPGVFLWPRFDFNEIDALLEKEQRRCSSKDIVRYFRRKKTDLELKSRHKRRAFWDDVDCEEWTEDSKYSPVQGKDEFAVDRATYNRRKSCLAFRKVGIKGANAEIYAGMFAGLKEPSDPPKYKLFTKFVSGLNVLDYQTEVGSFYFYLHSGKTKAYVRVMGRTRQEFTNDGCTPTELKYRPLKHVPLYMVSIANVQLSLGIQLSSRLSLDTVCPSPGVFLLRPQTDVRIGGEALGTVLFMRGAASLGGNFNYKLQFTFTPSPNMCLNGSHGFDPMNVNFESYFQLWNAAKEDWGKVRMWKPNVMFWRIREGRTKPWFKETCISTQETASGRELE